MQAKRGGKDPSLRLKDDDSCRTSCSEQHVSAVPFVASTRGSESYEGQRTHNTGLLLSSSIWSPDRVPALLPGCRLRSALGVSTLSYAWWMFTNKDLQHSNIYDFFFDSMIKRRYQKGGLDEARLEKAQVSDTNPTNLDS